jgi:transcriptional regulator with XRE-family HTH domain
MATMTRQGLDMMVVFVMGAIGSLIFLIRYLLSQTLQNPDKGSPVWRPLSWYLFRPLFGIIVAFAIYLLYKTGQVALGGANANVLASDVNLPILSLFSLFAGLLSWQALEMVESKGRRWLAAQRRENLWASGLRSALRQAGKTEAECAAQVGVTPIQVERWIAGSDKVIPEMQDRITTWLDRTRVEIFGDTNPRDIDDATLEWATGLKGVLKSNPAGIDVPRLAQLVEQDVATVQAWVDLKRQVDSKMQFLIADKLGVPREKLFSPERPDAEYWAVGLRTALHKGTAKISNAAELAAAAGSTPRNIRRYMELRDSVPKAVQQLITQALEVDHNILFSPNRPLDSEYKWAAKLRECMRMSGIAGAAALAEKLDVEESWVRSWMEQEICGEEDAPYCGQVPPATQPVLAQTLGCEPQTLFRAERPASDFRWAVMPRFADLVEARGGVGELASRLDLDSSRIERWMRGAEPVAPDTQVALLKDLRLPVEELTELFTRRPPPDPAKPLSALWATGLRAAVRANPNIRNLGRLAAELQIPPAQLFDAAELLEPVSTDLRDGILRVLGPAGPGAPAPFSNQAPDWARFRWAPQLRQAMAAANLSAEGLAERLDVDLARVLDWMEMDQAPVGTVWAKDKVKRGQLCPASCTALLEALGAATTAEQLFGESRPESGNLWTVQPTFELAVLDAEGGLAGFAEQIEVEPERVRRWIAQSEPVSAVTQSQILKALGLEPGDAWQIFSATQHARKQGVG